MAPHDYAKRKPKKKQRKPAVSRWVMLLTLVVSTAFLAILIMLSQQPDDTKASSLVAEKTNPSTAITVVPKTINKAVDKNSSSDSLRKPCFFGQENTVVFSKECPEMCLDVYEECFEIMYISKDVQ